MLLFKLLIIHKIVGYPPQKIKKETEVITVGRKIYWCISPKKAMQLAR